jgi:RimJ/RimL family protein N-acetyltransferase
MTQVRLRPVESEDVPAIAALLAHPDLVGLRGLHHDRPVRRSVAALAKAVESLVDPEDGDAWVIDAGDPIGVATAGWWWDAHTPWAHVVIHPDHRRQGHGTSAALGVLEWLFHHTPATLVEYSVPGWDDDGLSFADSLGGDRIGVRRRTGIRHGRYHDTVEFAMLRATWEVRHAPRR